MLEDDYNSEMIDLKKKVQSISNTVDFYNVY